MSDLHTILVTGSSGLVGSRFVELFPSPEQLLIPDEKKLDITNPQSLDSYFSEYIPDIILHFAGFTDVSAAENQRNDRSANCWKINVEGTRNLVNLARNAFFIYISTDFVFSGLPRDRGPYTETHSPEKSPDNVSWYGFTKAETERLISPAGAIVRISNPVRASFQPKQDFLRKSLALYDTQQLYPLFNDQWLTVTYVDELCVALQKIIKNHLPGIFHISSNDAQTPFDIVSRYLKITRNVENVVQPSSVLSLNNPRRYPQFGGLSTKQTQKKLNMKFSSINKILKSLTA
jgi:dTDP-4-dehydrorhamnose reductase